MPGIYPTIIPGIYYFYANSNKNVLTATTIWGNGFTVRTWKNGYEECFINNFSVELRLGGIQQNFHPLPSLYFRV